MKAHHAGGAKDTVFDMRAVISSGDGVGSISAGRPEAAFGASL
jgi:hypothetical protein